MVAEGRDCIEVFIQFAAVKSAVNNAGKIILQDHIRHCAADAIESGNAQALQDFDQFVK